ncbi:MAG TPA: trypsin-like peptidase domain-containing protein [Candidatus Limnocylindria bacterium]|nr:trypsin-like peptidase domain-containing protein [Candidatus Limnocylindria bacterium]
MKTYRIAVVSSLALAGALAAIVYILLWQHRMITTLQEHITVTVQPSDVKKDEKELTAETVEKVITQAQVWRPIQEKVKDTVVQVIAQISRVDLLQPFKSPVQNTAYGSAFFINEDGDLITNAHVVNQAKSIWIQIPSLGKQIIDVEVVGLSPERDLALLRVKQDDLALIRSELGKIPYLKLGNSDTVRRADEVMALGYPLGQQSLKSTTGVISGREHNFIQMSAAINPGNSGGPLLNIRGEVIGINSAGIMEAQNVGYMIPINDLKIILSDLYKNKLLRKPFLGVLFNNATEALTEYLGNPKKGGCYVVEVVKNSTLYKAGVKPGDMIYEINSHKIDEYGDMVVPWGEDKISIMDYVSRLSIGDDVKLVVYRKGERKHINVKFSQAELPAIRKIYPGFEEIDYEIIGGMVVMQLTLNHVQIMAESVPGLVRFAEMKNQEEPVLVITHIFPNSQLYRSRTIMVGSTLKEVNGTSVHTLADLRQAVVSAKNDKFLTIKAADNVSRASENVFAALPLEKVLQEEATMARDYRYALSGTVKELLQAHPQLQTSVNKIGLTA